MPKYIRYPFWTRRDLEELKGVSMTQHEFVLKLPPVFAVYVATMRRNVISASQQRSGFFGGRTTEDEHRLRIARESLEALGFEWDASCRSNELKIKEPEAVFIGMKNSGGTLGVDFDELDNE